MIRLLAIAACLLMLTGAAGCPTKFTPPAVVKEAVWTPCPVDVPDRPVFPYDTLNGDEDIFVKGTTLFADRKAREAYEIQIRTRLVGCTGKTAPSK